MSRSADLVLAHGVGTRADLPIPVSLAVIGGGLAVVVSFVALGVLWRTPRLRGDAAGRPLPSWLANTLDNRTLTAGLQFLALGLTAVVIAVAFFGPNSIPTNLAPWAFYITFWVGLVVSVLLGPVWGRVNPLRAAHRLLRPVVGPGRYAPLLPRLGYWPAAVQLLAFLWLELAAPHKSLPHVVGGFLLGYVIVNLVAASLFGAGWFTRGDGFEVYSRLMGRLAPVGRRRDGVLVWRGPLNGADSQPQWPGLTAVVLVLLGSTAFDGLTRTAWWQGTTDGPLWLIGSGPGVQEGATDTLTFGLVCCVAVVSLLYLLACAASRGLAGAGSAQTYAHTLIPIAVGYAVAHYFSLFVFDGQTTWLLASDPFGTGANLLGTAGGVVDYNVVTPRVISLVQVGAIVLGHVVAVALAHDRALRVARTGNQDAGHGSVILSQLPLLAVMVVFTLTALALLLGG